MNTPKSIVTTVIEPFITGPSLAVTKITDTSPKIMAWPAIIFAKSLTINEKGFVNIPNISIVCIIGRGNFKKIGPSGHRISF